MNKTLRIITIGCILTVFCLFPAASQEEINYSVLINELKEAATLTDDLTRLSAYDRILTSYALKNESSVAINSKWEVSVDTDPMDDSRQIYFMLTADSGKSDYGQPIFLIIRNANNETELFVNWNDYLGSEAYVTMRVGAERAATREWSLSTTSKATFYPGNTLELVRKILENEKLVFQCTPYSSNPVTAVFDVSGLRREAETYQADLNW